MGFIRRWADTNVVHKGDKGEDCLNSECEARQHDGKIFSYDRDAWIDAGDERSETYEYDE